MKKKILPVGFFLIAVSALPVQTNAQLVLTDVIKQVVKKVINAMDLAVQQLQNKTMVLQNAQKEVENLLSKMQLEDISGWAEKQRVLFEEYYQELWQVKQIISGYDQVKTIVRQQTQMVAEYTQAYGLFRQDRHFTPAELDHMLQVYSGILKESLKNINQVFLVVNSLVTQMDDASRIQIIDQAAAAMQKNVDDLRLFNHQNIQLSLARATDLNDVKTVKKLYGIP